MNKGLIVLIIAGILSSVLVWWPTTVSNQKPTTSAPKLLNTNDVILSVGDIAHIAVSSWAINATKPSIFDAQIHDGMWKINNHHNFPADLASRIGTIIGAVINLKRGPLISADIDRHAELNIHDPLIRAALHSLAYGKHITLKNTSGEIVVDLIFGRYDQELERSYVRFAGDDRVYTSTAFLYLDANWQTWTKKPVFEHTFEACKQFEFFSFADKPFRENNSFSLNPKTFQWEYRQQPINSADIKEYSEYLMSVKFNDALPLNPENQTRFASLGMHFENERIVSAPIHHRVHCRDGCVYDVYVSDSFIDKTRDKDEQQQNYMIITLQAGKNTSASYSYRCTRFAFMVDNHFLDVIDKTPAAFFR